MHKLVILGAVALALAGCQPGRSGPYYGGGYDPYRADYGHDRARTNAEWNRRQERARWEERNRVDTGRSRSWAEERYRRTGYIDPADYGQPWVPREPRYGYGEP
jgi:poly(3-hydroxybutyrate) depolymerase